MSQGALNNDKDYLGDGVYINHDNFHTILTTEDGMSVQNTIYLEPGMSKKIMGYEARMREKYAEATAPIDRSEGASDAQP